MIDSTEELLRAHPILLGLLFHYRDERKRSPDREWNDRLMAIPKIGNGELSRLHGLLLAHGLVETRVGLEIAVTGGTIRECYRITSEGNRILRRLDDPYDWSAMASADEPPGDASFEEEDRGEMAASAAAPSTNGEEG